MQDNLEVIILYVAMVIFVMVFLKMVTRKPRTASAKPPSFGNTPDDGSGA